MKHGEFEKWSTEQATQHWYQKQYDAIKIHPGSEDIARIKELIYAAYMRGRQDQKHLDLAIISYHAADRMVVDAGILTAIVKKEILAGAISEKV